jgi:hypothetical protein
VLSSLLRSAIEVFTADQGYIEVAEEITAREIEERQGTRRKIEI